jgi:pimeloyl-ACP methyl ester carboxylesterase
MNLPGGVTELRGTIDEALINVLVPSNWNHLALLYAHGHRPVGSVRSADIDLSEQYFQDLLRDGWVIGMTSYRREGRIIRDAIKDMNNLRNFIINEVGIPDQVIIEGRSMGGCICTHIAELENASKLYDGVLAIGAALLTTDPEGPEYPFTHCPEIPIIYLTNLSETGPIQAYIDEARRKEAPILPALWEVSREGHNWTNSAERYTALRSLMSWIHYKTFITCRQFNNTKLPPHRASEVEITQTIRTRPVRARGKVTGTNIHNAFFSNFIPDDLANLGINMGHRFQLISGEQTFEVTYSVYPFVGVPTGALIAFETPEGWIEFSANDFAAKTTMQNVGLDVGSSFEIAFLSQPRRQIVIPQEFLKNK